MSDATSSNPNTPEHIAQTRRPASMMAEPEEARLLAGGRDEAHGHNTSDEERSLGASAAAPPYAASGGAAPPYAASGGAAPPYAASGGAAPPYAASGGAAPPYDASGDTAPPYAASGDTAPPYAASGACAVAPAPLEAGAHGDDLAPPKVDMYAPPPYSECDELPPGDVVISMPTTQRCHLQQVTVEEAEGSEVVLPPTYEEVQRIKAVEAQLETGDTILLPPHTGPLVGLPVRAEAVSVGEGETRQGEDDLLGTDLLFFLAFAAAFFFNWIGFVVLVCFCHSVAGRSGALAGFGLSLAKWAVIVRHSAALAPEANTWLLWLIMVLGLVICMRAVLQYLNAKREWQHSSPASRHRFLLFH